eukprot:3478882-Alexandrium_andersonii.AAC.1
MCIRDRQCTLDFYLAHILASALQHLVHGLVKEVHVEAAVAVPHHTLDEVKVANDGNVALHGVKNVLRGTWETSNLQHTYTQTPTH